MYSSSEAYDEEQKIDHLRLANWIEAFQMEHVGFEEKGYHASGHITGPDLLKLVKAIRP